MRKINIIETGLFVLFLIAYIVTKFNPLIEFRWVCVGTAFALGVMYFPFGFYTLRSASNGIIGSIGLGLLHSLAFVAIIFNIMKVDLSLILLQLLIVAYSILLIAVLVTSKKLDHERSQLLNRLLRPLGFFLLVLYTYVTYTL